LGLILLIAQHHVAKIGDYMVKIRVVSVKQQNSAFCCEDSPKEALRMTKPLKEITDGRVRHTLRQIKEAFIALLLEKGFEAIRVSDIVARAQVNRSTFYRHYTDKYDLAERLTELLFAEINEQIGRMMRDDPTAVPQLLFEHVAAYAPFYQAMLGPKGIPRFTEQVRGVVEAQIMAALPHIQSEMPPALPARYLAAAQVGVVQWWLEAGMPFPPERMAAYLVQLHTYGGVRALGLVWPD
jgi:AcrR family transcriptional regulator